MDNPNTGVRNAFKAPYAIIVTVAALVAGLFLIYLSPLHESAFAYGSGLVGGLFVTAVAAAAVRAYRSATVMAVCSLGMFMAMAHGIDAESFKDIAFKGLAGGVATGVVIFIKALLDRFKDLE